MIFKSSSIAPGDIPISESLSIWYLQLLQRSWWAATYGLQARIDTALTRVRVRKTWILRLRHTLSWHSFVIMLQNPITNKYRMSEGSWGTNFLSNYLTFSLFSPGVTYRVNYNLIKVGPLIPGSVLPLLSAVTIIVMVTGICRGQRIDDREPEHLPIMASWIRLTAGRYFTRQW